MPNVSPPIAAFTICGLEVAVSNKTIDYMIEYQVFKSAGPAWLARNDPKCKIEQSIIDSVKSSLEEDMYAWSADFSEDLQEKVENEFFDMNTDGWWDQVHAIALAAQALTHSIGRSDG
jgi:hypothetical protein